MPRVSKNHLKACTRVKLQAGGAPVFISLERLLRGQRARRRGIEDAGFAGAQLLENQSALPPVHDYDVVRWSHELQAPVASEHVQRAGRRRASLVLHWRRHLSSSSVPSLRSPRTSRSTSHASDMLRPDAAQQHRGGHPSSQFQKKPQKSTSLRGHGDRGGAGGVQPLPQFFLLLLPHHLYCRFFYSNCLP
jgi:hypothetical protein